ncbi:MAG: PAS domain S-box protein [Nitrospirota bacterium]
MADKKKLTKKGGAAATGAANKTAAPARTEKAGRRRSGAAKVSSPSRKSASGSRDITGRKRTEEEPGASRKLLETIIDAAPSCIKLITADGSLQRMNRAGLEMIEAESPDQVQGKCVYPLVSEEHREAFKAMTREVFKGKSQTLEFKMIGLKGRPLWLYTHAVPIRNEKGAVVLALAITIDITERKLAEEALHESERSLKTLMSNLPGMAYRCCNDRNWTMEYVSEGAVGLTGYQPADLIGNAKIAYNDLIRPDDQGPVWEAVQKAVGSRDKYTLNYRIRRADGQERWVWEQGQGVFSLAGDLLALEGFIIDVSERCLLEEERLKTQKLESIGTLAGGIAHDFNNLLQGIFGYISMAKMTLDQKEKSLAMLEQSEKALHQSVNLTTQLLTFSKGGKPVKRSLSLLPVIENAARFALSGSRSEYRSTSAPDLRRVEADEGQLGQVIQNIVLNADQAMPLGGCVEIAAQNVSASDASLPRSIAGKDHVLITIRDSGVGIPEQYLGKIFDPYFTTKEKGSGLGLATSYSIIRNHGGLIDVRSRVGKGTTFFLYLPASEAVAEESPGAAAPGKARSGRVLVLDDEKVVREVAGELLRALGHEAEFAESGEAALTMYREAMAAAKPFDVVILDLTIRGGMGGLETLGKLLEIDPGAKAVVSSGYSDEAALSNYREHGFRAFLKKPYNMDELQNTLSNMLG